MDERASGHHFPGVRLLDLFSGDDVGEEDVWINEDA
jgi:hypothetical protein